MAFVPLAVEEALVLSEAAEATEASSLLSSRGVFSGLGRAWRTFEYENPRVALFLKAKAIGIPLSYATVDRLIDNDWWKNRGDTYLYGVKIGSVLKHIPDEFHWNAPTVWDLKRYVDSHAGHTHGYEDHAGYIRGNRRHPDRYSPYPIPDRPTPWPSILPIEDVNDPIEVEKSLREDLDLINIMDGGRKRKADQMADALASLRSSLATAAAVKKVKRAAQKAPVVLGVNNKINVLYRYLPYTLTVTKTGANIALAWNREFTTGTLAANANNVSPGSVLNPGAAKFFTAGELADFVSWKDRYEQYRISEIRVQFIGQNTEGYGNGPRKGMLCMVPDMNDNSSQGIELLVAKSGFRFMMDSARAQYMTFKPHVYQASNIETLIPGGWLSTAASDVPHYGLKVAPVNVTHSEGAYTYAFMFRVKLEFRNTK